MVSRAAAGITALLLLLAPTAWADEDPFPGMALRERVEAYLDAERARLSHYPGHEGLLFEIPQQQLLAFLQPLRAYPDGRDYALGAVHAPEAHGGGVLALIVDYWRPEGRAARLSDRFHFRGSPDEIMLADIYAGHQRQLFLPGTAQLPRMRFRYPTSATPVETDSYKLLGVLIAQQPDFEQTWTNHRGQKLSVDLLMRNVRDAYMNERSTAGELADHTNLHRVELLLAWHARDNQAVDPLAIKRRFLTNELARTHFEEEETEVIGHYTESLGRLLADPSVSWTPQERQRVRAWLTALDGERYADLRALPIQHLAHLLAGLRDVSRNREKLQQAAPRNRGAGE